MEATAVLAVAALVAVSSARYAHLRPARQAAVVDPCDRAVVVPWNGRGSLWWGSPFSIGTFANWKDQETLQPDGFNFGTNFGQKHGGGFDLGGWPTSVDLSDECEQKRQRERETDQWRWNNNNNNNGRRRGSGRDYDDYTGDRSGDYDDYWERQRRPPARGRRPSWRPPSSAERSLTSRPRTGSGDTPTPRGGQQSRSAGGPGAEYYRRRDNDYFEARRRQLQGRYRGEDYVPDSAANGAGTGSGDGDPMSWKVALRPAGEGETFGG